MKIKEDKEKKLRKGQDGMRWEGKERDGKGRDGMERDGMERDGTGWNEMGREGKRKVTKEKRRERGRK